MWVAIGLVTTLVVTVLGVLILSVAYRVLASGGLDECMAESDRRTVTGVDGEHAATAAVARDPVDDAEASHIAEELWAARDAARARTNARALARVVRDPQRSGDLLHMQHQLCGNAVPSEWHTIEGLQVLRPGTKADWFLAVIDSRRRDEPERKQRYYVVVEADARGEWESSSSPSSPTSRPAPRDGSMPAVTG